MSKVPPAHAFSPSPNEGNSSSSSLSRITAPPPASGALDARASSLGHCGSDAGSVETHPGRYALVGRLANAVVTMLRHHGIDEPVGTWRILRGQFQTDLFAARATLDALGLPDAIEVRVANVAAMYASDDVVRPAVRRAYEAACARDAMREGIPLD